MALWDAVVASSYCFMQHPTRRLQDTTAGSPDCGQLMELHAHSLCAAMKAAGLDTWLYHVDLPTADLDRAPADGAGTAQAVRFVVQTCARPEYSISLNVGWVLHGDTGQDSYVAQNWTTWWPSDASADAGKSQASSGGLASRTDAMVDFIDFFLPMTYKLDGSAPFFANGGAAYPGECSAGLDSQLMEWGHWSGGSGIPFSKLLPGISTSSTAAVDCPTSFRPDVELQPCMPRHECGRRLGWTAGGGTQAALNSAVAAGNMSVIYDNWAQQTYLAGKTNPGCTGCVSWVDSATAQDFDFRLRHLKWRGVRGFFTDAVENDYDRSAAQEPARHWNQPSEVLARFRDSEVFVLEVGDAAAAAAGGLDGSSGDSLCRLFGARIAATADAHSLDDSAAAAAFLTQESSREHGVVERVLGSGALASRTGAVSAVACYGNVPQNPWPFKIAGRPAAAAAGMPSRRRDCHFTDTPSPSALKHLLKRGGGGAAE